MTMTIHWPAASCRSSESGFVIAAAHLSIDNYSIDSGYNHTGAATAFGEAAIFIGACGQATMASSGSDVRVALAKLQRDSIFGDGFA